MTSKLATVMCFATLSFGATPVFSDPCQMPSGKTWDNGKGAEVTLDVSTTGSVSGSYTTAIGCGAGTRRPLTGFCDGHAVAFLIGQPECELIASWSGAFDHNALEVIWHRVSAKRPSVDSIHTGTDTFVLEYMQ